MIIITLILTNSMRIIIKNLKIKFIKGCENEDSIFKNNFVKSCNDSNFFLSIDTLDLSLKIFQNLPDSYFQLQHNLNNFQLDFFF